MYSRKILSGIQCLWLFNPQIPQIAAGFKNSNSNLVHSLRNPPDVMTNFDKDKISDRGAQEIADYIYNGSDFRVSSKKR